MAKKAKVVAMQENKTSSILGTFTGKCCDASVFNNNSMKLNRQLFDNLLNSDEYKDAIAHRYYIGFLGHPEDPGCQEFKDACIVMTSMELRDNDEIYGSFDLIDTPVGRIVKSFIDAGVEWGISIRGAGDVDSEGNVDPDTFVFRGFDLVAFPAYGDAVPEFKQIAASKNLDDQVKYKRVCAAIEKNLENVESITSIEAMQKQFNPDSEAYKKLEARKEDIGVAEDNIPEEDDCPNCSEEDKEEIMGKKIKCMTEMYLSQVESNKRLQSTLASTQLQYRHQLKTIRRITASQQKLLQSKIDATNKSNKELITANKQLCSDLKSVQAKNSEITKELDLARKNNLIYKQKVESSLSDIDAKDSKISELRAELNKTVVASTDAKKEASNRGDQVRDLKAEISASKQELASLKDRVLAMEDIIAEYQQAYANIYANAVGIHASGLSVTASTSVSDLENMIQGATNTSNIAAIPSFNEEEFLAPESIGNDGDTLAVL